MSCIVLETSIYLTHLFILLFWHSNYTLHWNKIFSREELHNAKPQPVVEDVLGDPQTFFNFTPMIVQDCKWDLPLFWWHPSPLLVWWCCFTFGGNSECKYIWRQRNRRKNKRVKFYLGESEVGGLCDNFRMEIIAFNWLGIAGEGAGCIMKYQRSGMINRLSWVGAAIKHLICRTTQSPFRYFRSCRPLSPCCYAYR